MGMLVIVWLSILTIVVISLVMRSIRHERSIRATLDQWYTFAGAQSTASNSEKSVKDAR